MVNKRKSTEKNQANKSRAKVGKLQLNKETVKELSGQEEKRLRGGMARRPIKTDDTCLVIACSVSCI